MKHIKEAGFSKSYCYLGTAFLEQSLYLFLNPHFSYINIICNVNVCGNLRRSVAMEFRSANCPYVGWKYHMSSKIIMNLLQLCFITMFIASNKWYIKYAPVIYTYIKRNVIECNLMQLTLI